MKKSTIQKAKSKVMSKGLDPLARVKAVKRVSASSKTKKDAEGLTRIMRLKPK